VVHLFFLRKEEKLKIGNVIIFWKTCNYLAIFSYISFIFLAINRLTSADFTEITDSTPVRIRPCLGDVPESSDMSEEDVVAEITEEGSRRVELETSQLDSSGFDLFEPTSMVNNQVVE